MDTKFITSSLITKLIFSLNIISSIWNIIGDCDETYNYWEPLHYLIYGKGFQTWEYSPEFGLRSYLYLYLCGWPAILLHFLFKSINCQVMFYIIRLYLVSLLSFAEIYLYRSLKKHLCDKFVPAFSIFFLIFSAGSFISSSAFLPSSFALIANTFAISAWLNGNIILLVSSVGCSSLLGWPFSIVLGIPLAFDTIFIQKKYLKFIVSTIIFGFFFSVISILVDSYFYGKLIYPSINIILYNVFNSHGSELYGIEPVSFYIKNYFLNFNFAMFSPIVLFIILFYEKMFNKVQFNRIKIEIISLSVFFLWNIIFFNQPHKEERFLFPCYTVLSIISAITLHKVYRFLTFLKLPSNFLCLLLFSVYAAINLSRIIALTQSYSGIISLYSHLNDLEFSQSSESICIGREWHRFPSNFFIYPKDQLQMEFIKSDFSGQLPGHFASNLPNPTRQLHRYFNDENKEVTQHYLSINKCNYIVDYNSYNEQSKHEHNWANLGFESILNSTILSPKDNIKKSNNLLRSFYIPFIFEKTNGFVNYSIYKRKITV